MKETLLALARIDVERSNTYIGDGGAFLQLEKTTPNEALLASAMRYGEGLGNNFGTSWAMPDVSRSFGVNFDNTYSLFRHQIKGYWPSPSPITPDVESTFNALVGKWYETASASSNLTKRMLNENFLRIIGLGEAAIPCLLLELKTKPSLLIEALRAITRRNIEEQNQMTFDEEVQDWLNWGEKSGYI